MVVTQVVLVSLYWGRYITPLHWVLLSQHGLELTRHSTNVRRQRAAEPRCSPPSPPSLRRRQEVKVGRAEGGRRGEEGGRDGPAFLLHTESNYFQATFTYFNVSVKRPQLRSAVSRRAEGTRGVTDGDMSEGSGAAWMWLVGGRKLRSLPLLVNNCGQDRSAAAGQHSSTARRLNWAYTQKRVFSQDR